MLLLPQYSPHLLGSMGSLLGGHLMHMPQESGLDSMLFSVVNDEITFSIAGR